MTDTEGGRGAAGEPDFESVYRASFVGMVTLARTVLASADGAEEVVQEAFARVLARWDRIDQRDDPLPYVRSAVLNECRSRLRRRPAPLRKVADGRSAEGLALERARDERILGALRTLPTRQREVVALRYFAELSTRDTADALGIAEGTVKAHLHRAVEALAAELEELRHD